MKVRERILSIGKRKSVLTVLSKKLIEEGFDASWTNKIEQATQDFNACDFDLITWGRGVDETRRRIFEEKFRVQNPEILFVEGMAPIIPLLVDQVKWALAEKRSEEKSISAVEIASTGELSIKIHAAKDCEATFRIYHLNFLFRAKEYEVASERIRQGEQVIHFNTRLSRSGQNFMVMKIDGEVAIIQKLKAN